MKKGDKKIRISSVNFSKSFEEELLIVFKECANRFNKIERKGFNNEQLGLIEVVTQIVTEISNKRFSTGIIVEVLPAIVDSIFSSIILPRITFDRQKLIDVTHFTYQLLFESLKYHYENKIIEIESIPDEEFA
jgi:hypothetical protein